MFESLASNTDLQGAIVYPFLYYAMGALPIIVNLAVCSWNLFFLNSIHTSHFVTSQQLVCSGPGRDYCSCHAPILVHQTVPFF